MSQLEVDKIIPQSGTTLTIGDSGDTISFAEGTNLGIDTNTLVIDSTNNRVGIKNASPTVELDVTGSVAVSGTVTATSFSGDGSSLTGITSVGGATGVDFNDNVKARFGTGNDLEIFHDGSNSNISDVGTGQLVLRTDGTQVAINKGSSENMAKFIVDGACELYHDNSKKFETTSTGADVRTTTSGAESTLRVSSRFGSGPANVVISSGGTGDAMLRFDYEEQYTDRARIGISSSSYDLQFFNNGNNERMRITGTGNVGIGTSSPTFSAGTGLHVNSSGTDCRIHITNSNTGTTSSDGSYIVAGSDGALNILNAENAVIRFYTNSTARMNIDSNGHLLPSTTNTYDLGSSSFVWRNIYTSDFHMSNEGLDKGNDIDGTKGSWTFQEGEENLYLINNKNGKKYKFNLTEIE